MLHGFDVLFPGVDEHCFFWQTCVKLCSQSERDAIFEALQPDLLTLSLKKYAVFLVKKLIKRGKSSVGFIHDNISLLLDMPLAPLTCLYL